MGSERQVTAVCPWKSHGRTTSAQPCRICGVPVRRPAGTYLTTLSDPEVEALIADGEKRREESKALAARIARAFAVGPLEMFPFAPPEDGRGGGG